MAFVFDVVASILQLVSYVTGLTYKEINIIVYYLVIPFIYLALIDRIYRRHYLKFIFSVGTIIFFLSIRDFRSFSDWLFEKSVLFLLSFKRFGWDYVVASVIICVLLPSTLFIFLFFCTYKAEIKKILKGVSIEKTQKTKSFLGKILVNLIKVFGILLLLALVTWGGCALYFSPAVQHPKYEKQEKQKLLHLLGPYAQQIKSLNCKCYSCSDFNEMEDRICRFNASPEVMKNIVDHLKLKERQLEEWELNYIERFQKEGFSYTPGVSNNFECGQYAPFTTIFTNPQRPYGGLIDIFYNKNTGDACVAFQPYGLG